MNPIVNINPVGGVVVADIIDNHLVQRTYYGYTEQESLDLFITEMEE